MILPCADWYIEAEGIEEGRDGIDDYCVDLAEVPGVLLESPRFFPPSKRRSIKCVFSFFFFFLFLFIIFTKLLFFAARVPAWPPARCRSPQMTPRDRTKTYVDTRATTAFFPPES
jgi:hypothetical protein